MPRHGSREEVGAAVHALCPGPFDAAALGGGRGRRRRGPRGLRRPAPGRRGRGRRAHRLRPRDGTVGRARPEHGLRPRGGRPRRGGHGLGTGGRCRRALAARDDVLVAAKPAFAGALVADITCRSATQMVTVRPGVLALAEPRTPRDVPVADAGGRPPWPRPRAVRPPRRRRRDPGPGRRGHRRGDGRGARGVRGAEPAGRRRWEQSSPPPAR